MKIVIQGGKPFQDAKVSAVFLLNGELCIKIKRELQDQPGADIVAVNLVRHQCVHANELPENALITTFDEVVLTVG